MSYGSQPSIEWILDKHYRGDVTQRAGVYDLAKRAKVQDRNYTLSSGLQEYVVLLLVSVVGVSRRPGVARIMTVPIFIL